MQSKNIYFHPYLTYTNDGKYFRKSDGTSFYDGWSHSFHPTKLNDDALDLWELGKRAFESLNAINKIESQKEYDQIFENNREGLRLFRLALIDQIKGHPTCFDFFSQEDNSLNPDLDDAPDSVIIDIGWQITRQLMGDCRVFGVMFLFMCFDEIENSLIGMCLDGRSGVSSALLAAEAFANFQAIRSGTEAFQKVRSELASRSAIERYKRDPKQKARSFIKECWVDWQNKPERYSKQSDFVADVLSKIDTKENGDPIISFDTVLKKWIPEWTRGNK